jgi:DNA-binding HxlR family transcriptional regulator
MALFDLAGRRWVLRILWELHRSDPMTFRALQERCDGVSSSVLSQRLADLRGALLVERTGEGYGISPLGAELVDAMQPVLDWSRRWARELDRSA